MDTAEIRQLIRNGPRELNHTASFFHPDEYLPGLRGQREDALIAHGAAVLEPLCELLRDPEWFVRWSAARLLGRLGDERACVPLCQALRDAEPVVRERALEALTQVAGVEAVPALIGALLDENAWVRNRAAAALAQIGHPAVPHLIPLTRQSTAFTRGQALGVLGGIQAEEASAVLVEALEDGEGWVRRVAAEGLGRQGELSAVTPLLRALEDSWETVRVAAAFSLAQIAERSPAPELRRALPALYSLRRWSGGLMASYWENEKYEHAICRIEAALATVSRLPLPTGALQTTRTLPLPALPQVSAAGQLPLPTPSPIPSAIMVGAEAEGLRRPSLFGSCRARFHGVLQRIAGRDPAP